MQCVWTGGGELELNLSVNADFSLETPSSHYSCHLGTLETPSPYSCHLGTLGNKDKYLIVHLGGRYFLGG